MRRMQQNSKGEIRIEGLDLEEEARLLKEFTKDFEWVLSNGKELMKKYPEKVIAVKRRKVITSSNGRFEMLAKLKELGIDPKSVLITYIPEKPLKYLLQNQ